MYCGMYVGASWRRRGCADGTTRAAGADGFKLDSPAGRQRSCVFTTEQSGEITAVQRLIGGHT